MQRVLGFDWLLLFLQGNLHQTTVVLTMRILCQVFSHAGTLQKFREGVSGGGWLRDTECVLQNRVGTFLGKHSTTSFSTTELENVKVTSRRQNEGAASIHCVIFRFPS